MKKFLVSIAILVMSSFIFAENIVITSIQPVYSIVSYLTRGTNIKVYTPFGSDVSMTMSKEEIRKEDFDLSIAKKAQAVVNIEKVWAEDAIYGKARNYNINIIEIDASYSYNENSSSLFFNEYSNGKVNPFVWMGSKNIVKMANIISKDLVKIYPKNKAKIEKNVVDFTAKIIAIEHKVNEELLNIENSEVISLSENLQYFFNDLNIFADYVDYNSVNEENVVDLMKNKSIKTIVSDRWLKKKVVKAIKDAGGEFVVINTLDIPMDIDGKMDPEGIVKSYEENATSLINALSK